MAKGKKTKQSKTPDPAWVEAIFARLSKAIPHPETELIYASAFELLIAVMLSAQATDVSVNKATRGLFKAANTPEAMLALGEAGVRGYIKSIGLFNSKAANVIKTCAILVAEHGGAVPKKRAALEALPGVGRKTANVVLNTAFGEPTIAVDTHIFRISNRLGLATGTTPRQVEDGLMRVVPKAYLKDAHHLLILHGRYICRAKSPHCADCVLADICPSAVVSAAVS